jgi:hypothetical protein
MMTEQPINKGFKEGLNKSLIGLNTNLCLKYNNKGLEVLRVLFIKNKLMLNLN